MKNKMEDEAETMEKVTTEEQRDQLLETVRTSVDWLDEDGFDAETNE